ncbi:MAG: hypothetical protein J7K09_00120, partial [Desulfuromusa sp.]|nr:hypothetical protein [Desulfuromusa sp.]
TEANMSKQVKSVTLRRFIINLLFNGLFGPLIQLSSATGELKSSIVVLLLRRRLLTFHNPI